MRSLVMIAASVALGLTVLAQAATARASNDLQVQFRGEGADAFFSVVDASGIVTEVSIYADDSRSAEGFGDNSMKPERMSSASVSINVFDPNCTPDGEGCMIFQGEGIAFLSDDAFQVDNHQLDGARLTTVMTVVDWTSDPPPAYQVTLDVTWVAVGEPVTTHENQLFHHPRGETSTRHVLATRREAQVIASLTDPTGTVDLQLAGTGTVFSFQEIVT
jgi:hypothetical protein